MGNITRAAGHLTLEQVKQRMKEAKDAQEVKRWLIVYNALIAPRKAADIALQLGVSTSLVHKVIFLYNRSGAQALETKNSGGRHHEYLTKEEEEQFLIPFIEQAQRGELATTKEIHLAFEARVGHQVHETTIYRLLDRQGWRKLMPRSRHPKADPQVQEYFKKTLQRRFKRPFKIDLLMTIDQSFSRVQDEARFGRICEPRKCWAPPGVRPCTPKQTIRQAVYVFAAIAPSEGKMTALILPHADTEMMSLFLQQVSHEFADAFLVMQVDGASWHHSEKLHIPENVRLIFQPPYSRRA